MKKIVALLLLLLVVGCGKNEQADKSPVQKPPAPTLAQSLQGKRIYFLIQDREEAENEVWLQLDDNNQLAVSRGQNRSMSYAVNETKLVVDAGNKQIEIRFSKPDLAVGDQIIVFEHTDGKLQAILDSTDDSEHSATGSITKIEAAREIDEQGPVQPSSRGESDQAPKGQNQPNPDTVEDESVIEQTPKGPENSTKVDNDTDWIVKALAVRLGENEVNHKQLVNTLGPLTPATERFLCRWLEKGKAIEMVSVMKQQTGQGNQTQRMYMVCRYDPQTNLFVQTVTVEDKSQPWIDLTWNRKASRFEAEQALPEPAGAKGKLFFKWTDNKTLDADFKIIKDDKILLHTVSTGIKIKTTANDEEFDQLKASILQPQPDSN